MCSPPCVTSTRPPRSGNGDAKPGLAVPCLHTAELNAWAAHLYHDTCNQGGAAAEANPEYAEQKGRRDLASALRRELVRDAEL